MNIVITRKYLCKEAKKVILEQPAIKLFKDAELICTVKSTQPILNKLHNVIFSIETIL